MLASPPEPPATCSLATPHIAVNGLELYYRQRAGGARDQL